MIAPEFVLGQGKVSGFLAFFLSALCLAGVLCFHFPEYLTSVELRAVYSVSFLRSCLAFFLCVAFALALVSFVLAERKTPSLISMALVLVSVLLGGSEVAVPDSVRSAPAIGLDWFILDLLILTLIFVPVERLFARIPSQRIFREGWNVDLMHFFVSHILVQLTTFLIMAPALFAGRPFQGSLLHEMVSSQPLWLQVLEIVLIADLAQYWIHRLFHEIPWLWRFHQIHHSTVRMDWLAGSRLHLVDVLVTRSLTLIPVFVLGYPMAALKIYLVFVAVLATFIHVNFRYELRLLGYIVTTPFYHHWHHAIESEAINKNFAVHLPVLDLIFGTRYYPRGIWPQGYGIKGYVPDKDYIGHLTRPFRKTIA